MLLHWCTKPLDCQRRLKDMSCECGLLHVEYLAGVDVHTKFQVHLIPVCRLVCLCALCVLCVCRVLSAFHDPSALVPEKLVLLYKTIVRFR